MCASSLPVPAPVIICGRFEGVDQRVIDGRQLEEISIGDYVLAGGEVAAMVLLEAIVRLIPGVLGAAESHADESFENGLLEYPQYTRPQSFEGIEIPARADLGAITARSPNGVMPRAWPSPQGTAP